MLLFLKVLFQCTQLCVKVKSSEREEREGGGEGWQVAGVAVPARVQCVQNLSPPSLSQREKGTCVKKQEQQRELGNQTNTSIPHHHHHPPDQGRETWHRTRRVGGRQAQEWQQE